jgi:hypothetical protein
MLHSATQLLLIRITAPLAMSAFAYFFYCWTSRRLIHLQRGKTDVLLLVTYIASRILVWLIFALFLQYDVVSSDPRLFYIPQLEHFLAGQIPIRDFYYPYAPLMMPSMLPFYILLGHTLPGISLFAIFAEAVALFFFVKWVSLVLKRREIDDKWPRQALALYLLNPATLYWTVFQGYHSIVQTAYAMAAFYFLARGYSAIGYGIGLYSLAGAKILGVLDWPALLTVSRPRLTKVLFGALPLLLTYVVYQALTGDILFPIRFHLGYIGEGNLWYLTTALGHLHGFYSSFPGSLIPIFFFGIAFCIGFVVWMRSARSGRTSFSFQCAMGTTTFTMSIFFLFSLYTGGYYVPMIMLPAAVVATYPGVRSRWAICLVLLISASCITGDVIWASFGQPDDLSNSFSSSFTRNALVSFWILTILVRIAGFAKLAQLGFRVALDSPGVTAQADDKLIAYQPSLSSSRSRF